MCVTINVFVSGKKIQEMWSGVEREWERLPLLLLFLISDENFAFALLLEIDKIRISSMFLILRDKNKEWMF